MVTSNVERLLAVLRGFDPATIGQALERAGIAPLATESPRKLEIPFPGLGFFSAPCPNDFMLFQPAFGIGENDEQAEEAFKKNARKIEAADSDEWQEACGQFTCDEAGQTCVYDFGIQKYACLSGTFETDKLKKKITRSFCFGLLARGCFCAV